MAVDLDAEKFPIENLSDIEYWGDIVHLLMYDKKKFEDIASKALAVIRNSIHDQLIAKIEEKYKLEDKIPGQLDLKSHKKGTINPNHQETDFNKENHLQYVLRFFIGSYAKKYRTSVVARQSKLSDPNIKDDLKKSNTLGCFKLSLEAFIEEKDRKRLHQIAIDFRKLISVAKIMIKKVAEFINLYGEGMIISSSGRVGCDKEICLKNTLVLNDKFHFQNKAFNYQYRLNIIQGVLKSKTISDEQFYILSFYFKTLCRGNKVNNLQQNESSLNNNPNVRSNKITIAESAKPSISGLSIAEVQKIDNNQKIKNLHKNLQWINEIIDSDDEIVSKISNKRKIGTINASSEENINNSKKPKILTHSEIKEKSESRKNPFNFFKQTFATDEVVNDKFGWYRIPKKLDAKDGELKKADKRCTDNNLRKTIDSSPRKSFVLNENKIIKEVIKDFSNATLPYSEKSFQFLKHSAENFLNTSDASQYNKEIIDLTEKDTDYEKYLQRMSDKAISYRANKSNQCGQNPPPIINLAVNYYNIQVNNDAQQSNGRSTN